MSAVAEVSVVIPTYRRPRLLARCLYALERQTLEPHRFEIIVVDDGHEAATRDVVCGFARSWPGGPRIRCIESNGTRGPAAARNCGWRIAQAPLIAFTDDDTIPAPDWLASGLALMQSEPAAVALAGAIEVPVSEPPSDHERNIRQLEQAGFVTANCFVRRAALEQIGGFDERFTRAWREDTDLYFSLGRAGQVMYAQDPVVVHPVRQAPWGQALRAHANLRFDALLYKKHRRLYWRYVRPSPPWRYYAIVLGLISGVAAALSGATALAAAALALWLVLTAQLVLQRLRGTRRNARERFEVVLTSLAIPVVAVFWRLVGAIRWRVLFL